MPKPEAKSYIIHHVHLTAVLRNRALLQTSRDEGQRHDATDVHIWTVDVHIELQLLADRFDVLQALLVVGTGTTDPDLDLVLEQGGAVLPQSTDNTLESRCDVGEVSNTTTDEEDLALLGERSTEHEVEDGSRVVVGLSLGRSTRVLTVVGELISETSAGNGIGIDDRGTATSNQSPDAAVGVEDGQLERGTSLGIKLSDIGFLLAQLTTERCGESHWWASINVDLVISSLNGGQTEGGG